MFPQCTKYVFELGKSLRGFSISFPLQESSKSKFSIISVTWYSKTVSVVTIRMSLRFKALDVSSINSIHDKFLTEFFIVCVLVYLGTLFTFTQIEPLSKHLVWCRDFQITPSCTSLNLECSWLLWLGSNMNFSWGCNYWYWYVCVYGYL